MNTFTLATYGTNNDYSWTTEGWVPSEVPADTDAAQIAAQIAKQATEYYEGEIDAEEYAWEVNQIAKHIRAWLDENRNELLVVEESAPAVPTISEARGKELLRAYGKRTSFKSASKRQVDALRSVASDLEVSISQAVQYLDASFAYRAGEITREEWAFIQKNA